MTQSMELTNILDLQELEIDTFEVEELSGLDLDVSSAADIIKISLCTSSSTCSASCG